MREDSARSEKLRFVGILRRFSKEGGEFIYDEIHKRQGYTPEYRGDRVLAGALADFFGSNEEVGHNDTQRMFGVSWYHYIDGWLVDAIHEFRTLAKWEQVRKDFRAEADYDIPDLLDFTDRDHNLFTNRIARLVATLSGEKWLYEKLDAIFRAQYTIVGHAWDRFVRVAYREYLLHYKKVDYVGERGIFGNTQLCTFGSAGRLLFTFVRGEDEDNVQMTYVADDGDMFGYRAGSNSTTTPYAICVEMINEVTDNWDLTKMKKDTVSFG